MPDKPPSIPLVKLGRLVDGSAGSPLIYWGVDGSVVKVSEVKTVPEHLVDPELAAGWFRIASYLCASRQLTDMKKRWAAEQSRLNDYPTELIHASTRTQLSSQLVVDS